MRSIPFVLPRLAHLICVLLPAKVTLARRTVVSCSLNACIDMQYWNEEKGIYDVAGHEDDEMFKEKFWLRILNSLCDPG